MFCRAISIPLLLAYFLLYWDILLEYAHAGFIISLSLRSPGTFQATDQMMNLGYNLAEEITLRNSKTLSFLSFLPAAILLAAVGWGGLAAVVIYTQPTIWPRWLFFCMGVLALSGTAMPVVYFLNRRFPSTPPVEGDVILRQSIWFGIYGSMLAWLQLGRLLSPLLVLILLGVFILIEGLLRMWERSRWKPKEEEKAKKEDKHEVGN